MNCLKNEILNWNILESNLNIDSYLCEKIPKVFNTGIQFKKIFEIAFFNELRAKIDRIVNQKIATFRKPQNIIDIGNLHSSTPFFFIFTTNPDINKFEKDKFVIIADSKTYLKKDKSFIIFGIVKKIFQNSSKVLIEIGKRKVKDFVRNKLSIRIYPLENHINLFDMIKEYKALKFLDDFDFSVKNTIFTCTPFQYKNIQESKVSYLKVHLKIHYNESQVKAILEIFKNNITLIQGPPGTGKTRTILGIISILLNWNSIIETWSSFYHTSMKNVVKIKGLIKKKYKIQKKNLSLLHINKSIGRNIENCKNVNIQKLERQKIIICASSNSAIDENLNRILSGLPMCNLIFSEYKEKIVRIGPNYNLGLDHLSLENYVITWLSENDRKLIFKGENNTLETSRLSILNSSILIYATISCTGYSLMRKICSEEKIIIDEAAQAIELSTLIPIKKNSKQVILIGDVQQLPATVFSKFSILSEYDRSLFKRLQMKKYPVSFLETQYRMHPQISSFPARKFYRNGLKDSQVLSSSKIFHVLRGFGPLIFFELPESHEQSHNSQYITWCNLDETRIVALISKALLCLFSCLEEFSIGIIAGYNGQINELENYEYYKKKILDLQINTVDGFQGKEKDFIFFSCVRSKLERGIGFLSDCRRINVAFTRAKSCLWCIGNSETLEKNKTWQEALCDLKKRSRFFCIRKPFERSVRKLIYWSEKDDQNYFFDGDIIENVSKNLLDYISKSF